MGHPRQHQYKIDTEAWVDAGRAGWQLFNGLLLSAPRLSIKATR